MEETWDERSAFDGPDADEELIVAIVIVQFLPSEFRTDEPLQARGGG